MHEVERTPGNNGSFQIEDDGCWVVMPELVGPTRFAGQRLKLNGTFSGALRVAEWGGVERFGNGLKRLVYGIDRCPAV